MSASHKNLNLWIFLLISVLSAGIILYFTADSATAAALKGFKAIYILILFLLWVVIYSLDSLAIFFMVISSGEKISYFLSYRLSAIKTFSMMITPLGLGVAPSLIYFLSSSEKLPPGKSSSIVLTKMMINASWILIGALIGFLINSRLIMDNKIIFLAFIITCTIQAGFLLLIILIILFPHYIITFLTKLGTILSRIKFLKSKGSIRKFLVTEASVARRSFRLYFRKHKITFGAAVLSNGLAYLASLSVLYFILAGLGQNTLFIHTATFTALMIFLIGFLPTPGGSGFAEALFVLILSRSVPVSILGIGVIIWRLFIYYITAGIGFSISFRRLTLLITNKKGSGIQT